MGREECVYSFEFNKCWVNAHLMFEIRKWSFEEVPHFRFKAESFRSVLKGGKEESEEAHLVLL